MPELPEVETVVRGLRVEAEGLRISSIPHISKHLLAREPRLKSLVKDRFVGFTRRGKYILAQLESGRTLVIHLRMSGRIVFVSKSHHRDKHDHFVAVLTNGKKMLFHDTRKFGIIEFLLQDSPKGVSSLGKEATDITVADLEAATSRSSRPIKALLLDQSVLAGLGNIYVDESLHRSKIHPLRPSNRLSPNDLMLLARSIKSVLKLAIKRMGTTFDSYSGVNGNPGEYSQYLRVYNREETECRECGNKIIKIRAAGRGTHLCPTCQKL